MRDYGIMIHPRYIRAGCFAIVLASVTALSAWIYPAWWLKLATAEGIALSCVACAWAALNLLGYVFDKRETLHAFPNVDAPREIPRIDYQYIAAVQKLAEERPFKYLLDVSRFEHIGITEAQMARLAWKVMHEGAMMRYEDFTPHWRGFSRRQFQKVQMSFVNHKWANWQNPSEHSNWGIQLTPDGKLFLAALITYSPTGENGQKQCSTPGHDMTYAAIHTVSSGGGVD